MIRSFKCKETEKLFRREKTGKIPVSIQKGVLRKLLILDAATHINELRVPPGNRLEQLGGARKGEHSIRVNDQWRICFKWVSGNAEKVEVVDYH